MEITTDKEAMRIASDLKRLQCLWLLHRIPESDYCSKRQALLDGFHALRRGSDTSPLACRSSA